MRLAQRIAFRHNEFGKSHLDKHSMRASRWKRKDGSVEFKKYAFPYKSISYLEVHNAVVVKRNVHFNWSDCHSVVNRLIRIRQDIGTKNHV